MDLAAFLAARLDEDEAAAHAVAPLGYTSDMGGTRLDEKFSHARVRFASEDGRSRLEPDAAAARHFARHDPARVLREVAAGRDILAAYQSVLKECATMLFDRRPRKYGEHDGLRIAVLALAAVWSDHPDYDPAWAVSG